MQHIFACPKCGSEHVSKLAEKHDRCLKAFHEGEETEPATTYAFQCECGVAFTVMVRDREHARA